VRQGTGPGPAGYPGLKKIQCCACGLDRPERILVRLTHAPKKPAHLRPIECLAISPDGKRLAAGGISVKVWDAETGKELSTFGGLSGEAFCLGFSSDDFSRQAQTQTLAFSPDARRLAVILSEQDKTAVKVWDATTGKLLRTLPMGDALCVAFAPDGARLAVGGAPGDSVWEIGP
jgi:WD40 repeat protein